MQFQFSFWEGGILNKTKSKTVDLEFALHHIRTGVEADKIRIVRQANTKEEKQEAKKKLSYFTFSGTFTERKAEGLVEHSNLICLDFDDVQNIEALRMQLQTDPYVRMLFRSPSATPGLKLLIWIDGSKHLQSFLALQVYFYTMYGLEVDKSGKDVPRACYTSFDEAAYYNPDSQAFLMQHDFVDEDTGELVTMERPTELPQKPTPKNYVANTESTKMELVVSRVIDAGVDLTQGYENWQLLAFSMASLGEEGRGYFHRLSALHPEYDERACDKKFDDARKNGRFTSPGWFYKEAQRRGIDIKVPKYHHVADAAPAQAESGKPQRARKAKQVEDDDDPEIEYNWPVKHKKAIEAEKDTVKHLRYMVRTFNLFFFGNELYLGRLRENAWSFERAGNFNLEPLYMVTDEEGNGSRVVKLTNIRNESRIERIPTESFTSVTGIAPFIEKSNFIWDIPRKHYVRLKEFVFQNCLEAVEVSILGYNEDGFYSFANGIVTADGFKAINDYGVVEHRKRAYFLPALSSMFKEQKKRFQFERTFRYIDRPNVSFSEWAELFVQVYGENGRIGLMFALQSIFSSVLFKIDGFFPLLFLYGKPDSGKTTMAMSILSLFHPTGEVSLGSNITSVPPAALAKQMGQMRDGIVMIEEYQPDLDRFKMEFLKQIWNRLPYTKSDTAASNTSNKTVNMQILSAAIITGQHLPIKDIALLTRCMLCQFFQNGGFTKEQGDWYNRLKEMQDAGLSAITASIFQHRAEFEEAIGREFKLEKRAYAQRFEGANVGRLGLHAAMAMASYKCFARFLKMPFTEEELRQTVDRFSEEQERMMSQSDESNTFWEIIASLVSNRLIDDSAIVVRGPRVAIELFKEHSKMPELINFAQETYVAYIRFEYLYGLYSKEMRSQGRTNTMDKGSLRLYLVNSLSFLGSKKSFKFKGQTNTALVFNYTRLLENGIVLEIQDQEAESGDTMHKDRQPPTPVGDAAAVKGPTSTAAPF
jgi:hypothetical protein